MHGPHQPAWDFYREQFDFIARNNWVFQTGIPRMDLAIWQKRSTYPGHVELRTYAPTDLEDAGYSYEYLSPDNFNLPAAKVVDGILAPDAQAFKALIVRVNDSLTLDGVSKLVEFAHDGLAIIFAAGFPSTFVGSSAPTVQRQALKDLDTISKLPNVHVTASYLIESTVSSLGIAPLTKVSTNGSWYTYWRSDPTNDTDYVFIYNDAMYQPQGNGASEGTIEFQSTKIPYDYNAWTGETRPILTYYTTNTSTIIPFRLAGNQSAIVAFIPASADRPVPTRTIVKSSSVLDYTFTDNGTLIQMTTPVTFKTSTNDTKTIQGPSASPITLSNWTLIVEHWDPPTDLYNYTHGALKHNTTHQLPHLVSWLDIPSLQNVSGRGYYSTTFIWPPPDSADGAFIDFGAVYHTLQASVNGRRIPPLDVTHAKADITNYLVAGVNKVEAVVATPLGNVLRPIWSQLMSSGEGPASADAGPNRGFVPPPQGRYGLIGDVTVVPWVGVWI
jgi:hypothetical protein